MVLAGMGDDGLGGIGALQHVIGDPVEGQAEGLGPGAQQDETGDVQRPPLPVRRLVDTEALELQHVDAGEPGSRQQGEHSRGHGADRRGHVAIVVRQIDGRDDDGRLMRTLLHAMGRRAFRTGRLEQLQ